MLNQAVHCNLGEYINLFLLPMTSIVKLAPSSGISAEPLGAARTQQSRLARSQARQNSRPPQLLSASSHLSVPQLPPQPTALKEWLYNDITTDGSNKERFRLGNGLSCSLGPWMFFSNNLRTPLGLQEVFDAGTASAQTGAHWGCSLFTLFLTFFFFHYLLRNKKFSCHKHFSSLFGVRIGATQRKNLPSKISQNNRTACVWVSILEKWGLQAL